MPIFIRQGLYTRAVIKGMIVKPEDHADAAGHIMSRAGGRNLAPTFKLAGGTRFGTARE
jgi:hypothetical protein